MPEVEAEIIRRIDAAKKAGDTLGGEVEVVARGVVVGLGSHVSWDRKLDGRLAGMLMSIPAVKAVEVGLGVEAARRPGSAVHDPIDPRAGRPRCRPTPATPEGGVQAPDQQRRRSRGRNHDRGTACFRVAMKPISTLMSPLPTVDLATGQPANAQSERSDVTAVPALGVIAEAVVALVLADAMLEKFGGDSLGEMRRNYDGLSLLAGLPLVRPQGRGGGIMPPPRDARRIARGRARAPWGAWCPKGFRRPLIDIDQLLVRQVGRPVDQIFGMMGEPVFRQLEREAVAAALAGDPAVIVPGRGWAAQPGQFETARGFSLIIYLKCTAGPRPADSSRAKPRPLLAGVDPVQRMRALLESERHSIVLRIMRLRLAPGTRPKWRRKSSSWPGAGRLDVSNPLRALP